MEEIVAARRRRNINVVASDSESEPWTDPENDSYWTMRCRLFCLRLQSQSLSFAGQQQRSTVIYRSSNSLELAANMNDAFTRARYQLERRIPSWRHWHLPLPPTFDHPLPATDARMSAIENTEHSRSTTSPRLLAGSRGPGFSGIFICQRWFGFAR